MSLSQIKVNNQEIINVENELISGSENLVYNDSIEKEIYNMNLQNAKDAFRSNLNIFNGHYYKGYFGEDGVTFRLSDTYWTSMFIEVEVGKQYSLYNNISNCYIYAYDETKTPFIIDEVNNKCYLLSFSITIPNGVQYVRFVFLSEHLNEIAIGCNLTINQSHSVNSFNYKNNPQLLYDNAENVLSPLGNSIKNIVDCVKLDIKLDKLNQYVYLTGVLRNTSSTANSGLIYIKGIKYLEYNNLYIDSSGYIIALYDKDGLLLPTVSVIGNSDYQSGIINLTDENYTNAYYCIASHYGDTSSVKFILYNDNSVNINTLFNRLYNYEDNEKLLYSIVSKSDMTIQYDNPGYVMSNSGMIFTSGGYNTGYINTIGYVKIFGTSMSLDNSANVVSFYNRDFEYISNLSIVGTGATVQEFNIELTDKLYNEVSYVIISTWSKNDISVYFKANYVVDISYMQTEINRLTKQDEVHSINIPGYIKVSDGSIGSGGYNTGYLEVSGFSKLNGMSKSLDLTAVVVAFYDKNKNQLTNLNIIGNSAANQPFSINLKDDVYSTVLYVIVSSWTLVNNGVNLYNEDKVQLPFLYKKNFCALGDSITDGDGNSSYSWYDMLLSRYNSYETSLNFAVSGQCLRTMADNCTQENMANIDFVFVMGGTNQLSNYRLGSIDDEATPDRWLPNTEYNIGDKVLGGTLETHGSGIKAYLYWYECIVSGTSSNETDASNFPITTNSQFSDGTVTWKCVGSPSWYSDMKGICRRVWGFKPTILIIWFVPIKTKADCSYTNPSSWARAAKFQAIRDFCTSYSIKMIDLQKEFPLNIWTKDYIMADNLHPNDKGYKIIEDIVCSHIE